MEKRRAKDKHHRWCLWRLRFLVDDAVFGISIAFVFRHLIAFAFGIGAGNTPLRIH
jgi:hypothetical protein